MPTCFRTVTAGAGQSLMPEPRTDYANCEFVVLAGADYQQMAGGLYLSAADGAVASGLIVSCWVAAYAARSVIAVFRGSSKDE